MSITDASNDTMDRVDLESLLVPVLPAAYRLAASLTRNRADAEDVVQDAAFNACRGFDGFEQGTNFKAWFFKIVYNVFVSQHRRRRRAGAEVAIEAVPEADLEIRSWSEPEANALTRVISRVDAAEILRAIDALPEEFRAVATLYFVDDLPYRDIAAVLDIPVGTVRSRLHRGRAGLMRALHRLGVERGLAAPARAGRRTAPGRPLAVSEAVA